MGNGSQMQEPPGASAPTATAGTLPPRGVAEAY